MTDRLFWTLVRYDLERMAPLAGRVVLAAGMVTLAVSLRWSTERVLLLAPGMLLIGGMLMLAMLGAVDRREYVLEFLQGLPLSRNQLQTTRAVSLAIGLVTVVGSSALLVVVLNLVGVVHVPTAMLLHAALMLVVVGLPLTLAGHAAYVLARPVLAIGFFGVVFALVTLVAERPFRRFARGLSVSIDSLTFDPFVVVVLGWLAWSALMIFALWSLGRVLQPRHTPTFSDAETR